MHFFSTFFFFLFSYYIKGGAFIKKNIGVIILSISLCIVFSKAMFTTYKTSSVMSIDGNIYILQYGSYISKDVMEENTKKLDNYLMIEEDDKYYVYLSVFTNKENALKMQRNYEKQNIYTYLKNDYISDEKLIERIKKIEEEIKDVDIKEVNKKIINELKKM